jgi:hypothetical protein
MNHRSFTRLLNLGARITFLFAFMCGLCFNEWAVQRVYAGEIIDISSGGVSIPHAKPVAPPPQEAKAPQRPRPYTPPALGGGCHTLSVFKPRDCKNWRTNNPKLSRAFSRCREEALSDLLQARAAQATGQLLMQRGNKISEGFREELIEVLHTKVLKDVNGSHRVEAPIGEKRANELADQMIREYQNAEKAFAACRKHSGDSAYKHNMVLAGVVSEYEFTHFRPGVSTTCGEKIRSSIQDPPSDNDHLTNHIRGISSGNKLIDTYKSKVRQAKGKAREWHKGASFWDIGANDGIPRDYSGKGWDNLGHKLYALDVYNECSKGEGSAQQHAEGASKVGGFIKNNWGKILAGTVIIGGLLCLVWFCRKKKKRPPVETTTTTTTTTSGNTNETEGNTTSNTAGNNTNETEGTTTAGNNTNETEGNTTTNTAGNTNETEGTTTAGNNTNETEGTTTAGNTNETEGTTSGTNENGGTTDGPPIVPPDEGWGTNSGSGGFDIRSLAPQAPTGQRTLQPRSGSGPRPTNR